MSKSDQASAADPTPGGTNSAPRFTWTQLLSAGFTLVLVSGGVAFSVARILDDSLITQYQLQTAQLDRAYVECRDELASSRVRSTPNQMASSGPYIGFQTPRDRDSVPQFVEVEYGVRRELPARYAPVLLVKDPLGQYWSWGVGDAGYHARVQVGLGTDVGRTFEIGVLITNEDLPRGVPMGRRPPGLAYEAITVVRR